MTEVYYIIYRKTKSGGNTTHHLSDLSAVSKKLQDLFQARLKAEAWRFPDQTVVGEVHELNGRLTWYCEEE